MAANALWVSKADIQISTLWILVAVMRLGAAGWSLNCNGKKLSLA